MGTFEESKLFDERFDGKKQSGLPGRPPLGVALAVKIVVVFNVHCLAVSFSSEDQCQEGKRDGETRS